MKNKLLSPVLTGWQQVDKFILGNMLDNRANRGVSDFDRTHRFVLSSLWDLPRLIPSSNGTAKADATGTDIGNVGRNILRGLRQSNVDISLIKRCMIRESKTLEFHFDAFNILNHVNLANPISDFNAVVPTGSIDINKGTINNNNAGAFGRIISTSSNPRIIQLAVKFSF